MARPVPNSKVALVYARALFDLTLTDSSLDIVNQELQGIVETFSTCNKDFLKYISTPMIPTEDKRAFIFKVIQTQNQTLINFIDLLLNRNRLAFIEAIAGVYSIMVDEYNGILRGELKLAKIPDKEECEKLLKTISSLVKKRVELKLIEDKGLVAGFSARLGSYGIDYSFDLHLRQIEKKLIRG